MKYITTRLLVSAALCLALFGQAYAVQNNYRIQHQAPTVIERQNPEELTFTVAGINADEVQDAFLFYRLDGDLSYQQVHASLSQSEFSATPDISQSTASGMEYYFEIQFTDGSILTYPENYNSSGPIRLEIVEEQRENTSDTNEGIEYTILSPEPGGSVAPADMVLAITLFYDEGAVDTANTSFELILDGENVTEQSKASNYFFSYAPDDEINLGEHTAELRMRTGDATTEIATWNFSVVRPGEATSPSLMAENAETFMPQGQAQVTARNQIVGGVNNDILNGNVRLSGQKGDIRYSAHGLLTSQEDPRLQAQNRYGAELYVGDWLELQAGHIYPSLSQLTISGQRVRGINTGLHMLGGGINLQVVYGEMRRSISNLYQNIQANDQVFNNTVVDTSYSMSFQSSGVGTYQRDILGGRLGFGSGEHFQWGLNFLKVQDDTNSIDIIDNYADVLQLRPSLADNLTQEQKNDLASNPNSLNVNGNPLPRGNFVAGSDLAMNFHNNRIQLRSDVAVSLLNENISGGPLDQQAAEDLGFDLDSNTANLLDRLSWLIIVNENMSAIPLRFETDSTANETTAEPYFPTSILASQSQLSLNYFDNNIRVQYRWVGPEFNSLANSTVRKDIAGFSVTDRFRLLDNRIYITLGYENLEDNVVGAKEATTNTVSMRGNVSWYPVKRSLPRVSLGIMNRTRENGVNLFNPFVSESLESAAIRNYITENGQNVVGPNPRMTDTYQISSSISQQFNLLGMTHNASVNYSILTTTDEVFAYGDTKSNNVSFNITNRFKNLPLDTQVGASYNQTETTGGLAEIDIYGVNVGGSMYFFDDKLNVDAQLAFTKDRSDITPLVVNANGTPNDTSDDYYEPDPSNNSVTENNSFVLGAGARYRFDNHHALVVNMRLTSINSSLSSTSIPNDRLLQARYIFSF